MAKRPPLKNPRDRFYLADWLKIRGLTPAALSRRSDVSEPMISLILRRRTNGSTKTLHKIASALDVRVGELFDAKPRAGWRVLCVQVKEGDIETLKRILRGLDAELLDD
jgi:transcriptional regulator with XRE-family HTH domain